MQGFSLNGVLMSTRNREEFQLSCCSALLTFVDLEKLGKLLFQSIDLGLVTYLDIWVLGMIERVVLMVGFRIVEGLERNNLGHNRLGKYLGRIQLGDVSLADLVLFFVCVENHRAIRRTHIRPLAIELRR